MKLRATILGCGSSGGVPRLGGPEGSGDWGACDPSEPRNRRRRSSILVQRLTDDPDTPNEDLTTALVDTSPDLREQLLSARIARLDAVVITHEHADQCHGLDDLRAIVLASGQRVPVHFSERTAPSLRERFAYCFEDNPQTGYPAILEPRSLTPAQELAVHGPSGSIPILPILVGHGPVPSLAFRFGAPAGGTGLVYSPDLDEVPEGSWPSVMDPAVWIVDALRYRPHASHSHLAQSLEWLARSRARRGVLTNLHIDMDYRTVSNEVPDTVVPAHDGMTIDLDA